METVLLSSIDLWIIILYLLGVTSLGLWVSRGIRSSKDFFLAGRSLPWWMAGMSMVVSDIGAKDMIGLAGDAYRYGIVMMNFEFVGATLPLIVAAFLFVPFFWRSEIYTIPEYLGRRYSQNVRTFFCCHLVTVYVGYGCNYPSKCGSNVRGPSRLVFLAFCRSGVCTGWFVHSFWWSSRRCNN